MKGQTLAQNFGRMGSHPAGLVVAQKSRQNSASPWGEVGAAGLRSFTSHTRTMGVGGRREGQIEKRSETKSKRD